MTRSAQTATPATKPVEKAPSAERDSLLTFTVQPPEMFDRNEVKIESVAFSKYYICIAGKDRDGMPVVRFYTQNGRLAGELETLTGERIGNRLLQAGFKADNWIARQAVIKELSTTNFMLSSFQTPFMAKLASLGGDGSGIYVGLEAPFSINGGINSPSNADRIFWSPGRLAGGERTERYFVLKDPDGLWVVDTQHDDGTPRDPKNLVSSSANDETAVQRFPFLKEYTSSIDGRALPNGKHYASHVNGILTITQVSDLQRVHADACNGYAVDPADNEKLVYVNPTSHAIVTVDLSKTSGTGARTEGSPIPFEGKITDMKFDPVGNFLLFTVTDEGGGDERMVVVEKSTSKVVAEVPGVRGTITLDQVGTIYFVDTEGRLRVVNSNLKTVPLGGMESLQEERRQRAAKRLEEAIRIVLPELPEGVILAPTANIDQIEDALSKTIQGRFKGDVAGVKSIAELDKLEARIGIVRSSDEFADAPDAFSLVDADLVARRHALRAEALGTDALKVLGELQGAHTSITVATLREVDAKIATLKKDRAEVAIQNEVARRTIDETIGEISKLRAEAYRESIGRAAADLEKMKGEVSSYIAQAGSVDEVYGIVAGERYAGCQALIDVIEDAEQRKTHREGLERAIESRINELERDANAEATKVAERKREAAEATAKLLEKLTTAVGKISSTADLTAVKSGALMVAVTKATMGLSAEDQDTVQATISGVLQRAAQKLQTTNQLAGISRGGGEVAIGSEKFPVAGEYSPTVKPTLHTDEGTGIERLAFQDGFGRLFLPPDSPLRPAPGTPEYDEWRERAMSEAVSHFRSLGRKVPELRPNWIVTRHTVECLERIIRELRFQRESGQGILILEGEAGTGKNVLIDLLAHLSKHERFLFACNFQTQKEDFTYEYAFTPQKGTFRVSAKLLEKLVTPYSFNAFDEINTLPPGVLKMLNALLDERRTLYLPDGREIPVDPTSYLVGFMNPRHYIGTQELSPEIVSRATFVQIPYPPEKRAVKGKDLYAPDEALMLSRSVRGLSSIPQEEFEKAWDAIVNKVGDKPASISADQERLIQGLHTIVKVANAVRRQYTNFQTNQGTQQMDFVFCLRTGASIARRLKPDSNVREIIKEVVLPKISSHESKTNAEMLIATT